MKKIIAAVLCAVLAATALAGCKNTGEENGNNGKLNVVCTLFPQFDFVREIAGDRVNLTLLLKPGSDSHGYDPSPADMIKINGSDLFVYTGELMEGWAAKIIASAESETLTVLDVSREIEPIGVEDEHAEDEHEHHDYSVDPHIWTSPANAEKIVAAVTAKLAELDAANADYYRANSRSYLAELESLDAEIRNIVNSGARKRVVFGGRFAFRYFTQEYGLDYLAAFDTCSEETEPSPAAKIRIINAIKDEKIPVVFGEELSNNKVAQSIADETGAKLLVLHSCHNLSAEEFNAGEGYLSLMQKNAENLRTALS